MLNIIPIKQTLSLQAICNETFDSIVRDPEHRLHSLLPFCGPSRYPLTHNRRFVIPTHFVRLSVRRRVGYDRIGYAYMHA